ncbi:MAG: conserved rane protein of unknown function [Pseudonocardiales bacterium]|nr:conserved rane protein of unknown function [Pseudonocardiales bacterium]
MQLWIGLALYGISMDLMVRARLGLDSWDVLHQGLSRHTGLSMGVIVIIVGVVVLIAWIPLRQRPGFGTLCNAIMVGAVFDLVLPVIPVPHLVVARVAMLVGAIALCGLATGMYISVGWGAGPRDGLMVGLARRTGVSVRITRTALELTVLVAGWLLGGSVGIGTVVFALSIGPASQLALRWCGHPPAQNSADRATETASAAGLCG